MKRYRVQPSGRVYFLFDGTENKYNNIIHVFKNYNLALITMNALNDDENEWNPNDASSS